MPTLEASQPSRASTPEARAHSEGKVARTIEDQTARASFRLVPVGGGRNYGRGPGIADLGEETREPIHRAVGGALPTVGGL